MLWRIERLIPRIANPRTHSPQQITQIAAAAGTRYATGPLPSDACRPPGRTHKNRAYGIVIDRQLLKVPALTFGGASVALKPGMSLRHIVARRLNFTRPIGFLLVCRYAILRA